MRENVTKNGKKLDPLLAMAKEINDKHREPETNNVLPKPSAPKWSPDDDSEVNKEPETPVLPPVKAPEDQDYSKQPQESTLKADNTESAPAYVISYHPESSAPAMDQATVRALAAASLRSIAANYQHQKETELFALDLIRLSQLISDAEEREVFGINANNAVILFKNALMPDDQRKIEQIQKDVGLSLEFQNKK